MDKQRVNRITARFEGNDAIITLYRTNRKLVRISNVDLGINPFDRDIHTNKMTYLNYCKDVVQDLLTNDGIPGFYFSDKQNTSNGFPNKFDTNDFIEYAGKYVHNVIESIIDGKITVDDMDISVNESSLSIGDRYKDGHIKYGEVIVNVLISADGQALDARIPILIKSGQICKPKQMILDDTTKPLNITNIKNMMK